MSMELSTFKILYGYNKAKTQRWMFGFFLTTGMSPLLLLKKVYGNIKWWFSTLFISMKSFKSR